MTEPLLSIGTRVKLSPKSIYYIQGKSYDGKELTGRIIRYTDHNILQYRVEFENSYQNSYGLPDLIVIPTPKNNEEASSLLQQF